jgi:hypothetical protein
VSVKIWVRFDRERIASDATEWVRFISEAIVSEAVEFGFVLTESASRLRDGMGSFHQ